MAAIQHAAEQLIRGVSTQHVIAELKETYRTLACLSSKMSLVRSAVVDRGHAPPDDFRMPRDDTLTLKRKHETAVIEKNEHLIIVPDFATLLRDATMTLQTATPDCSFARLILALCVVSGRRLTEICSPRSAFTPLPDEHYALFHGALKKRGKEHAMIVPLLVPFDTFNAGLLALRQKQGSSVAQMSNAAIKARYQGSVQRDLTYRNALQGAPSGIHIHDLRSVYLSAVYELFDCPYTLARTGMLVLGHETLREHLSYNNVRLEGVGEVKGSLGELRVDTNSSGTGSDL